MQKHTKVYLGYYEITDPETIRCEVCWMRAVDIHHIVLRSKFWKKTKHLQDSIENLIALCRHDHERAHLRQEPYLRKEELQEIHNNNLRYEM